MTELKSMTAYVLEQIPKDRKDNLLAESEKLKSIFNYAKFLSMPLELKMFVTCDENDSVMKEPTVDAYMQPKEIDRQYEAFDKAKSEVIFEGFEYQEAKQENHYCLIRFPDRNITPLYPKLWHGMTIEDLVKYSLTLTPQSKEKYKF